MARIKSTADIPEALTFDDVLMRPGHSEVLPSETDVRSRITRRISLNLPIISSAMDTVTEARLAIAMAQAGGLGVIHRNLTPEEQADHVRQVKRFESGIVLKPFTIAPDAKLGDALALMRSKGISGVPVTVGGEAGRPGRLVGILTNRDVRFADDPGQPVSELMTSEGLITVRENVTQDEARRLFHRHRIEKLVVVDDAGHCVGLLTVKDIEKAILNPNACKDEAGRLRVAAATTTGDQGFERAERLIDAGVDLVVIDTAHGHSQKVLDAVGRVKRLSNAVQVVAGNVATAAGARALIDAGADAIKVGIGPAPSAHPHRRRRRRAAAFRRDGDGGGGGQAGYSRHRRRRRQILGRPRQGDRRRRRLRDDRLAARRHGREPRRDVPLPGPLLQGLPRHGLARRHGARLRRPIFPGRHQGHDEARARGRGGPGSLQGPRRRRDPSARRRPQGGHGYVGANTIRDLQEKAELCASPARVCARATRMT